MKRRMWLAGAGAGVAGASLAWWRLQPGPAQTGAERAFWSGEFEGLNGQLLPMTRFLGRPLLVNFWATWCPPCVEELPLINQFYRQHYKAGWQVLGLAVDQSAPVRRFLDHQPLEFSVALAGFSGIELSRSLGNAQGALPFSVVFGANGTLREKKLGKLSADELTQWSLLP